MFSRAFVVLGDAPEAIRRFHDDLRRLTLDD